MQHNFYSCQLSALVTSEDTDSSTRDCLYFYNVRIRYTADTLRQNTSNYVHRITKHFEAAVPHTLLDGGGPRSTTDISKQLK